MHQEARLFDVEELSTHGGSIRIYARHSDYGEFAVQPSVARDFERRMRWLARLLILVMLLSGTIAIAAASLSER